MEGPVGLCAACAHARAVVSGRGSTFWLCGLAAADARFAKYPRLPVLRCAGFEHRGDGDAGGEPADTPPAGSPPRG